MRAAQRRRPREIHTREYVSAKERSPKDPLHPAFLFCPRRMLSQLVRILSAWQDTVSSLAR